MHARRSPLRACRERPRLHRQEGAGCAGLEAPCPEQLAGPGDTVCDASVLIPADTVSTAPAALLECSRKRSGVFLGALGSGAARSSLPRPSSFWRAYWRHGQPSLVSPVPCGGQKTAATAPGTPSPSSESRAAGSAGTGEDGGHRSRRDTGGGCPGTERGQLRLGARSLQPARCADNCCCAPCSPKPSPPRRMRGKTQRAQPRRHPSLARRRSVESGLEGCAHAAGRTTGADAPRRRHVGQQALNL